MVRDLDATVRKYVEDYGIGSCEFSGIKVAYLGTQRDLGVILQIANGMPDGKQKPDAT